ncbi:MAG: TonB-dependent receptor plug domain-containing protein, partial [Bacteroidales bacterium]|nr:TonB-dependent receptor plug domain-containing protein [Bacteroidales bacterium]
MKRIILIVAIATAALPVKAQDVNEDVLSQRASAFNLLENLSGTVAGASVLSTSGRPGGNPMMMIRGIGSINGDTAPLYVVDGISGADPSLLNAADIESVTILKEGAATALYGVRGANGV